MGASSTTNSPIFKIVCNCIHELLNVFEDSTQLEHTIVSDCNLCDAFVFLILFQHAHCTIIFLTCLYSINCRCEKTQACGYILYMYLKSDHGSIHVYCVCSVCMPACVSVYMHVYACDKHVSCVCVSV